MLRVSYQISHQEQEDLKAVGTSIDVVTEENVVGHWRLTANIKKLNEVLVLTVNVTTDCDWTLHVSNVVFLVEYLNSFLGQLFHLCLGYELTLFEVLNPARHIGLVDAAICHFAGHG